MGKYDTIIFDLDGTLLNTLEDLAGSVNYALKKLGYPDRTVEEVRQFVGNGVEQLINRAVPEGLPEEAKGECLSLFKEHYAKHKMDKTCPYEGIMDLLKTLQEKGYKMGIVSNKFDKAVKELNTQFFQKYIEVAIGESETVAKKPAPDTAIVAMVELQTDKKHALYVGDSDVDIQTAHNAGMDCLSVSWGFRSRAFLEANGASVIIDKPEEIFDHI